MASKREDLEQILKTCLELIQTRQETLDSVLARFPEHADEIRPLLEATSWMNAQRDALAPRPGFVAESRQRLMARLEHEKAAGLTEAPPEAEPGFWDALVSLFDRIRLSPQYVIASLLLVFLVLSTSSVAAASQRSIPGDTLYPVKTSLERVHLALTFNEAHRAALHVDYAKRRLTEIRSLVTEKRFEYLDSTINQFESQADQASLPMQSLADTNAPQAKELATELKNVIDEQTIILPALAQDAPVGAQNEIKRLMNVSGVVRKKAENIEAQPLETPTPTIRVSSSTASPGSPTPVITEVAGVTPVPETTFTPTSTPSPEAPLNTPTETATLNIFPTPTEPIETGSTTVPTSTLTTQPPPIVSFSVRSQTVSESRGTLLITVQLQDGLGNEVLASQDVSLPFSISGSAMEDSSFTISPSPLVISTGSSHADIAINLKDDGIVEPDKTIIITMGTPTNAVLGSPSTHTITITHGPTVFFTLASQSVHENARSVDIEVQLMPAQATDVTVPFSLGGTAILGQDYTLKDKNPLVIPAGQTKAYISLSLVSDGLDEPDKTVEVTLGFASGAVLSLPKAQLITLIDDDPLPEVSFFKSDQSVKEDVGDVKVQVQLSAASSMPITVPLSLSGSATPGIDYLFNQSSVVIPPGSKSATLTIQVVDDSVPEAYETVVIAMGQPTNAVLGTPNAFPLTLIDDDPQPEVTFAQPDQSVEENVGNVNVQVQLSVASSLPITVPLSLGGSATSGVDYIFNQSSVVIPPGSTSASFTLQVVDDLLQESSETVVIAMGQPTNAILGKPNAYLLTLIDNDPQPEVTFVQSDQSVDESAGYLNVQLQLSAASSLPITVPISLNGSATPGVDYLFSQSTVVIPPGSTSAAFTLQVVDDLLQEAYETVVIAMGQPTNAVLGTPNVYLLTLIDNDPQPEVTFVQSDQSVEENVGNVSVQLQLSAASSLPITVPLSMDGSATPGIDYLFAQSYVVFTPGSTSASFTFQVLDDPVQESSKAIVITLGEPVNAISGVPNTQSVTILPNDQPTCNIFASNNIVFSVDDKSLEWTLSNLGSDTLLLTQLTVSWPTVLLYSPNLDRVYFDTNLIFEGNESLSPQTITSWLSLDSSRLLTSSSSTVIVQFNRALLQGNYILTLVFRNITQGFDCTPVTQSIDHP